jgi:hypothetical protein
MADETELIELQQIPVKAWLTGDRAMVERIIAPEWTSTGPDGRTAVNEREHSVPLSGYAL